MRPLLVLSVVAVVLAGCGDDDDRAYPEIPPGRVEIGPDGSIAGVTFTPDEIALLEAARDAAEGHADELDQIGLMFVGGEYRRVCSVFEAGTPAVRAIVRGEAVRFGAVDDLVAVCPAVMG